MQGRILGAMGAPAPWVTKGAPKKERERREKRKKKRKKRKERRGKDRQINMTRRAPLRCGMCPSLFFVEIVEAP